FPYISRSFSEFWTRWHISLSTWLREYLYIPLGGNRKGNVRTYFNLMAVMVLGGLWHGAGWNYAGWGGAHGAALAIERFAYQKNLKSKNISFKYIRMTFVFITITCLWLLFKLSDVSHVLAYFDAILKNFSIPVTIKSNQVKIVAFSMFVVLY